MIKIFLALLLLIDSAGYCQQKETPFHLIMPKQKVAGSLYNTLYFIDARSDTSMGLVQKGVFNRHAGVVAERPFSTQFKELINSLIDSTSQKGKLLFQLRDLRFWERTNAASEYGFCHARAKLYVVANGFYLPLSLIDTLLVVKSIDVTNGILKKAATTISSFVGESLQHIPPDNLSYTFADVRNIDSMEKLSIPVYTTAVYKEGLYTNYSDFKYQTPGHPIKVEIKKEKITAVKFVGENGSLQKVKARFVYAIVYHGQPYLATANGYYPLLKVDNDFVCTGEASVKAGDNAAVGTMFHLTNFK
jgi:uncharacterized protein with FMN-binding domain